ncbi:MAG: hypothetical protein MZU95_06960 [Desulfomicrobium escambiense]|nr:hypothetical protein [Desulfomicrobium escambiense]
MDLEPELFVEVHGRRVRLPDLEGDEGRPGCPDLGDGEAHHGLAEAEAAAVGVDGDVVDLDVVADLPVDDVGDDLLVRDNRVVGDDPDTCMRTVGDVRAVGDDPDTCMRTVGDVRVVGDDRVVGPADDDQGRGDRRVLDLAPEGVVAPGIGEGQGLDGPDRRRGPPPSSGGRNSGPGPR